MTEPKDIKTLIEKAANKAAEIYFRNTLHQDQTYAAEKYRIGFRDGAHFGLTLGKEETEKLLEAPINVMGLTLNQITELIYHYTAVTGKDPKEL